MKPVLFYDGDCALCNHSVLFLVRLDNQEVLRYAPLESETARELLGSHYNATPQNDAVTLLVQERIFVETDAIIQSLLLIKKWTWLVTFFRIIPGFLRNGVYRWVARHRSKIFKSCPIIPEEYSHLFL